MDYHILYDKDKSKMKMAGKMILNKIMGSRKRLVISLMLAVLFIDFCILASPSHETAARRATSTASSGRQAHAAPGDHRDRAVREAEEPVVKRHRLPTRFVPGEREKQLQRDLQGEDVQSPERRWEGGEQERDEEVEVGGEEKEREEEEPQTGTGWELKKPADDKDIDTWDKLNEVDVDVDGSDPLHLGPVGGGPKRRPTTPTVLVRLEVEAGEEAVDVKLDGVSLMVPDTNNRTRGLHVLVLEQNTHAVMARRRFDTVLKDVHREAIHFLDAVRPGRIIILVSKDDMSFNMHSELRSKLTELGSQFIPNLGFRDQWAMVTIKGSDQTLGETFSPAPAEGEYGGPLFLRLDLTPGSLPPTPPCDWPDTDESARRHAFCDTYEGHPGLCRCLQPHPIVPETTELDEDISSIFTVVMATHRPYYLYRALRSLAFAPGAQRENIVVYLENSLNPELEALVGLFEFKVRYIAPKPSTNIKGVIGNRVMDILNDVFTNFMEAEYVLFLEEDLECSPDIFRYFGQTRPLLEEDPSLFSVSALNRQSYRNTSHVAHVAYRVDSLPPAGFLIGRNVYDAEIKPAWPQHAWKKNLNTFLNRVVKGEREVVVPDVNRVYHIGLDSQFVNTGVYDQMSKNLSVNPDPTAALQDVTRLHKLNYEEDLLSTIDAGVVIRDYNSLCSAENMTTAFTNQNKTEILYFSMENEKDISTWFYLAKCWGLWPYSATGHHGGLWRFWLENKKGFLFHIVFIGVPFSRYASHKPADVPVYRASAAEIASVGGPAPPSSTQGPPIVPDLVADSAPGSDLAANSASGSDFAADLEASLVGDAGDESAAGVAVGQPPGSVSSSREPAAAAAPAVAAPPPRSPSPAGPSSSATPVRQASTSSRPSSPQPRAPAAAPAPAASPAPSVSSSSKRPSRPVNVRNRSDRNEV